MIVEDSIPWLLIFLYIIEAGIFITFSVLWFRSMQRAMTACHPVSRSAEPETVWLNFIPLFGLVWQFVCVGRLSDSIAREYHRRGWHSDENRPALELGIVAGVVICVSFIIRVFVPMHPGIGFFSTLAMILCMYLHTNRLNSFRERLEKELDPTTAFGQIPVMNQIVATAFQSDYVLPQTHESIAEQLRSSYTNIPFVPQTPFVPVANTNIISEEKDFSNIPFMPNVPFADNVAEHSEKNDDGVNRWAPPGQKQ